MHRAISQFLRRAISNESSVIVKDIVGYGCKYRNCTFKCSLGKGVRGSVPGLSLLGSNQTAEKGIYPCVLIYLNAKKIVVAYGVSEKKPT